MAGVLQLVVATTAGDKFCNLVLESAATIGTVKALVEAELSVATAKQQLYYKGNRLNDSQTLTQCGFRDNDLIELRIGERQETLQDIPNDLWRNPSGLIAYIRDRRELVQQLIQADPDLANVILSENPALVEGFLTQRLMAKQRADQEALDRQAARHARLAANPFDLDAQREIAEEIKQKNINENWEMAMEHNPESFARVIMLYVPMEVNKTPMSAFVDSGAQSTIMSEDCAKRCNIMHLVDTRYAGIAKGVGTAKIVGRVHAVQVKIGQQFFVCSFTILEGSGMDFLFGLDQLKRHQASIDLKANCLRIGEQAIPFLSEKDLPDNARESGFPQSPRHSMLNPDRPSSSSSAPSSSSARPPATASRGGSAVSSSSSASSASARPPAPSAASSAPHGPPGASAPSSSFSSSSAARPPATVSPQPRPAAVSAPAPQAQPHAQPQSQSASHSQPRQPAASQWPEAKIALLTNLGFARDKAIQALTAAGGNEDAAASILFSQQGGGRFGFF